MLLLVAVLYYSAFMPEKNICLFFNCRTEYILMIVYGQGSLMVSHFIQ